ncbi:MAG: methionine--tRNA ligase [Spirochaetaceae bacterium]
MAQPTAKRRLITSALPYVNNIPHLGNLIQVLSADVFARFCRLRGYETLYICGTDEYGTATETRAREEGITPQELCARYYAIHRDIYEWFNIAFDRFGRTSTPKQTEITQGIFLALYNNGYIKEREIEQLYSEKSDMFLADRYVRGTCPNCGYVDARGDQCENCGKLLDPTDLINPRSIFDDSTPVLRKSRHLYIDLPAILPKLQSWIDDAARRGKWARNAVQMTQAWIRDGLRERAITRDLKWGIPVPLEGFQDKVFYVWFDAPIGYISITANHTDDWESWWKNPDNVELTQFIGKDNIPFHTVIFPSSLLGTGENWTLLHHMSSSEYLNYEGGQFSKSRGVGVFGNDAQDTGIPADVWRFYIFYNRPETSDFMFTWDDFQEKVNGELIGNLSNLVNRATSFISKYFQSEVASAEEVAGQGVAVNGAGEVVETWETFWREVERAETEITAHLENAELRDAFRKTFMLSSYGNRIFQQAEPWKTRKDNPEATKALLHHLIYLVRDLAILISPYIPDTGKRIAERIGAAGTDWSDLRSREGIARIERPKLLFSQLEDDFIEALRERFSGTQAERKERPGERARGAGAGGEATAGTEPAATAPAAPAGSAAPEGASAPVEERFRDQVDLRAARILEVERHPKADKLYIEKIDDGSGETRQIVSGLVPYYSEEDLQGKTIVLVHNLKPAKLRGVKSEGMLLAADGEYQGEQLVDVLFLDDSVQPGTRVVAKGYEPPGYETGEPEEPGRIDIDTFFSIPLAVEEGTVKVGEAPLTVDGAVVAAPRVLRGSVG